MKRKLQVLLLIGVLAVLFMVLIYPTLPEQTRERFSIERVEKDKGTGRFETWDTLIKASVKDPEAMIFGLGIGSTVPILEKANSIARYAHNQWIQVFCDQGFVGLFFFGYLILSAIVRNLKKNPPVSAGMIGIIALSMSLTM
ncbi:O-antigen ligase [Anaerotaenia torta]